MEVVVVSVGVPGGGTVQVVVVVVSVGTREGTRSTWKWWWCQWVPGRGHGPRGTSGPNG